MCKRQALERWWQKLSGSSTSACERDFVCILRKSEGRTRCERLRAGLGIRLQRERRLNGRSIGPESTRISVDTAIRAYDVSDRNDDCYYNCIISASYRVSPVDGGTAANIRAVTLCSHCMPQTNRCQSKFDSRSRTWIV